MMHGAKWILPLGALALSVPAPAQAPADSGSPSPRAVVEAMFAAFNRHDIDALVALYAEDVRLTSSDFCTPRSGHAGVRRTYSQLFEAFPDITDTVEAIVAEGEQAAVKFTARSRAPGRELTLPIMTFLTVRDGRIHTDDSLFDTHGQPCSN